MISLCLLTNNINQVGGIERVISTLTTYFVTIEDWEVTIISLYSEETKTVFSIPDNVEIVHAKLKSNIKQWLRSYFTERKFDMLLTFHPYIGFEISRIRKYFPNMHWIATEHSSPYEYTWKRKVLNLLAYHRAEKLVVLTQSAKKYYVARGIFHTDVIPNALSFETKKRGNYTAKKIIAVGRLEEIKGFDILIKAFAEIVSYYPEWTLNIVGSGTQEEYLQKVVAEYHLEDNICFYGASRNIKEHMLNSSFLVISSKLEGFSLVAIEALECGLPLVSFELPSIMEITDNYKAAIFVQQRTADTLADKMEKLIVSPELLQNMGEEAKECANNYRISKIGKQWKNLIESLI